MKRYWVLTLLFLVFSVHGYCQAWTFRADIENMPDLRIYLASVKGDQQTIIDSAASLSGSFKFKSDESLIPGVYRVLLGSKERYMFGNETRSFDIIVDGENIVLRTDYSDPVRDMEILSSEENKIYYDFIHVRSAYGVKFRALIPLLSLYDHSDPFFKSLSQEFIRVQQELTDSLMYLSDEKPKSFVASLIRVFPEPVYYPDSGSNIVKFMREHYFDLVNMNDPALLNSPVYTQKVITYLGFFREPSAGMDDQEKLYMKAVDGIMAEVKYNRDVYDFILNYIINGFERLKMENVLVYIADNYLGEGCETDNEKIMNDRLDAWKKMAPGQTVSDIVLRDNHNDIRRLSDMDAGYTLLVFWASWCPHCRELMPELKNWYESRDRNHEIEIYSVSIDTSIVEWKAYLKENDLPWTNVIEADGWEGKVARQFNLYATPAMFILDRKREIIDKPITLRDVRRYFSKLNK